MKILIKLSILGVLFFSQVAMAIQIFPQYIICDKNRKPRFYDPQNRHLHLFRINNNGAICSGLPANSKLKFYFASTNPDFSYVVAGYQLIVNKTHYICNAHSIVKLRPLIYTPGIPNRWEKHGGSGFGCKGDAIDCPFGGGLKE